LLGNLVIEEDIDEELKRDLESIKQTINKNSALSQQIDISNASPNSKFLSEKFSNIEEGEKVLGSYACALS
jgi:hypothetical protein